MSITTYPKIDGLFLRDPTNKKIVPDAFRSQEVKYLEDNDWIWTEKIDGTNIRIIWDGYTVSFAGRTDRAQIPSNLLKYLEKTFGGQKNEQLFEQKFGNTPAILFGEGYGPGIQKGGNYRNDVSFILFDVFIDGVVWLQRESIEDIASYFSIEVVPIVQIGSLGWAMDFVKTHPHSIVANKNGKECFMEGLVGVPIIMPLTRTGKRIMVKVKWDDLKELVN